MFRCRKHELEVLNRRYSSGSFECVIIYGRRRVGKTALIKEFVKDKAVIFFSALDSSSRDNLKELSNAIGFYQNPEEGSSAIYQSYEDALAKISALAKEKQLVFVIDEYPYLAKAEKSISSRLQHIIDHKWQQGNLFLILCGSSMSFMEKQVLGYESPLYGRRTAQIKLEQLTYLQTAEFNPGLTYEERALVYGITGGIPHYINKLGLNKQIGNSPAAGVGQVDISGPSGPVAVNMTGVRAVLREALLTNLFEPSAYLFEEPANLLKQELREPAIYNSVIGAIANGASRQSEIAAKVGIETGLCSKYLQNLIELGLLGKEMPITDDSRKKTIYFIQDNFFSFWYRFVPLSYNAINTGRMEQLVDRLVMDRLHEYMGLIFEKMCREYLQRYASDLPITLMDIGRWWGTDNKTRKQVEIDIVGVPIPGEHGYVIGSCKFRNEQVEYSELELIRHYANVFGKGQKYYYYIFSLGGFSDRLKEAQKNGEVVLIGLEAMYSCAD